jgi:hypothetical protein
LGLQHFFAAALLVERRTPGPLLHLSYAGSVPGENPWRIKNQASTSAFGLSRAP